MDWRNLLLFVWDSGGSIYLPGSGRVLRQTAFYLRPGEGDMKGGDRGRTSRNILSGLWINQSVWSLTQKSHVLRETLLNALWWPIWEKNLKKGEFVYIYNWFTLLYSKNKQHCKLTIFQWKLIKINSIEKEISCSCTHTHTHIYHSTYLHIFIHILHTYPHNMKYTYICLCVYVYENRASKETFSDLSVLDLQSCSLKKKKKALQVILFPLHLLYLLISIFLGKKSINFQWKQSTLVTHQVISPLFSYHWRLDTSVGSTSSVYDIWCPFSLLSAALPRPCSPDSVPAT